MKAELSHLTKQEAPTSPYYLAGFEVPPGNEPLPLIDLSKAPREIRLTFDDKTPPNVVILLAPPQERSPLRRGLRDLISNCLYADPSTKEVINEVQDVDFTPRSLTFIKRPEVDDADPKDESPVYELSVQCERSDGDGEIEITYLLHNNGVKYRADRRVLIDGNLDPKYSLVYPDGIVEYSNDGSGLFPFMYQVSQHIDWLIETKQHTP